jgi:hypothetical protein
MTTLLPPATDRLRAAPRAAPSALAPTEVAPTDGESDGEFVVGRPQPSGALWPHLALAALLAGTGVLYLWALGRSGWANTFYSAAVQAGTKSWKAMFFGSSDGANFITIDKPPASLWVMDVSARLFGVNSWSILVPEALEGVAAVGIVYATVRRWFGSGAGLLAGAVLAVTPVAALMFRFNNPDALLVLLLTGAAYAMVRALEAGQTRWLVLASTLVGFGFLTKMLQALLVVPAFALVYLIAAPNPIRRRVGQLALAGVALVVASLWWVVAVELIPASSRPYIGGSQDNSIWNLMFGYNGFGRLTGNETGSVGGGGATGSRWGLTGLYRMFNSQFGGQASWLIPAALILLFVGLLVTWRAPRVDRTRAALLLWGGWLVVTAGVFSFGRGIIHPYYTVALAHGRRGAGGRRRRRVVEPAFWVGGQSGAGVGPGGHGHLGVRVVTPDSDLAPVAGNGGPHGRAGAGRAAHGVGAPAPPNGSQGRGCTRTRLGRHRPGGARELHPCHGGHGSRRGHPLGRTNRRWGSSRRVRWRRPWPRCWRFADRKYPDGRLDLAAPAGKRPVHVGCGSRRIEHRSRLPAGHLVARHGDRRLQRDRPLTDAGPVPARRGGRKDPLLHRRWRR